MTSTPQLVRGVIRGDDAEVTLTPVTSPDELVVLAAGVDETVRLPVEPEWCEVVDAGLRVTAPLSDLPTPLRSVRVVLASAADDVEPDLATDFELGDLFPRTDGEFARAFTWEGQRIRDRETLRFAAAQVVRHAPFRASRIAAAASIVAYRSLDLGEDAWVRTSLEFIDDAIARIDELEDTGSVSKPSTVRTDRTHLSVSLCTIRWHLALHLGDFPEVLRSLELGFGFLEPVIEAWSVGYNGSKIVLLYGFMLWQCGETDRAEEVWGFAFTLYQRVAASASPDNPTLFNDHRTSHRVAYLAMVGLRNMNGDPTPNGLVIDAAVVGDEVYRVKDRGALGRLRTKMDEMVVWAADRRSAKASGS